METNPTRMCELLVGLPEVRVLGMFARSGEPITVHIETRGERPSCARCGASARVKDRPATTLVDLAAFGRAAKLCWHKRRWRCPEANCPTGSWTEEDRRIAAPRMAMTDRAGRWVTEQVGRRARSVSELAHELGCDWHTVNDAVIAYGAALIDDPGRYGTVDALGLDEVLFCRVGTYRRQEFSSQFVDVRRGQLIDIVPGRSGKEPIKWLEAKEQEWKKKVRYATLDLAGSYRAVFDKMLPHATQVADPFHVIKLCNTKLDDCRRRVQEETMGHRGHKADPLYRCRRLLTKAHERLAEKGNDKLLGLLNAGDPKGEVTAAWHAKEAVRALYTHEDLALATEWLDELILDMADTDNPVEVRSLGRTLKRWRTQILA